MPDYDLRFSTCATDGAGTYKLLELPPDLVQLVGNAEDSSRTLVLTVKGQPNEDAVLCTNDKTYALRSVALSNSVLVITSSTSGSSSEREAVFIRDELHEILEITPTVPKLHKLGDLLRGREYDESDEPDSESKGLVAGYYSYQDVRNEIQASDTELDHGLKEKRVLVIRGFLRPISKDYLQNLLEIILNLLSSLGLRHDNDNVPLDDIVSTLADEHEVPRTVTLQLLAWFGELDEPGGKWKMDTESILKEVGIGLLRHHRHESIAKAAFMAKWKDIVGDTFAASADLDLLSGTYLVSVLDNTDHLTYFPSSDLPVDPAQRFTDLFLTRSRWRRDDIAPFLQEIAINPKERDKLLLKYCRTIPDTQGAWYTSRTQHGS